MQQLAGVKILFIAGFGPIVRDATASRKLYNQLLGIDFKEETGGYLHTEALKGANSFTLWPLSHAAQSCFGKDSWPNEIPPPQREVVLPDLNLSVSQAARDLAVARQTLHRILAGSAAITPEMSLRLERLCGVSSRFWLERQNEHELRHAEAGIEKNLSLIPRRRLPGKIMSEIGAADGR
jgi:addiction module HigA family antidote